MKDLLKDIWHRRILNIWTVPALILLYLEVFHFSIINQFYQFLFLEIGKNLITNLMNNPTVIASITAIVIGGLTWIRKKEDNK